MLNFVYVSFECQKQIFIAPHRRLEENDEQQLHMERAFEDMYMSATGDH